MENNTDKLIRHLQEKWGDIVCPMCKKSTWNVDDRIFEIRKYGRGALVVGENVSIMPVTPVICMNCGNTVLINAITAGLIEPDKKDPDGK